MVRNDRIAEVGQNLEVPEDTEILEANGKLLCPGFIDIHRHADVQPLLNSKSEAELRQGITTAVFGCVSSLLCECAFERHVVTPEDAICKMIFVPAKRFCFTDRGKIAKVCKADLLVFDPEVFADNADFFGRSEFASGL